MYATAPRTVDTPAFELQVDTPASNREIPHLQDSFVVSSPAAVTTMRTEGCFFRLLSLMTRAYRSPNTPLIREAATKPGNVNSERIDWGFFMRLAYPKMNHFSVPDNEQNILLFTMSYTISSSGFAHTFPRRPGYLI
jgi:hypothetical protein